MARLLNKPVHHPLSDDVQVIHDLKPEDIDLAYIGFKVLDIKSQGTYTESTDDFELCIVALTGNIDVSDGENSYEDLGTRESVFEKIPTDSIYISKNHEVTIKANKDSRVVLCYSPADEERATQLIPASENSVEDRGKYSNKRHVHNILPDTHTASEKLLVVEVYTDQGNWSSYPPHKHDVDNLPNESLLEETYYHEMNPSKGFVFQRVFTDDLSIDETMTVENSDVVVVPKGYHPVAVPDGYDGYYLNVMAGPKKVWKFYNQPDHEWIIDRE
ncbi:5-deoxy-glucuronate isomerase [Mammaliicoccus sciuri]|uniref:5-deoxy-glucuronate isomerase n=1 Tax=Mammaliicoccus TaxID=2803850 RepID=UPI000BCFF359|nr:5-deoxy-glucuronate isomerase [Mammaliicoccus sciuri]PCQ20389.1 5-deoxy-glucuronate isomerase [Klebsiella pneumoniae]MBO3079937.1 5-deoxy-glucuronate isomerase [Mammaliicoccus sciuri]MCD8777506.1 5-deoxy-glucuronate isomerase [Mammaliicoccus sciuri]MCD8782193.1 5-deoxy-glucuronate isomerase [Mammaliicoccus sciuri]MCD8860371.1 5-deoxy-glucuronate isomerase [Mammaliicoccus sciuri]